jgi:hypothetical protein
MKALNDVTDGFHKHGNLNFVKDLVKDEKSVCFPNTNNFNSHENKAPGRVRCFSAEPSLSEFQHPEVFMMTSSQPCISLLA